MIRNLALKWANVGNSTLLGNYSMRHFSNERRKRLPFNTIVKFVPQQEAWIIERFGKFHRMLKPGLSFLFPIIDSIPYVHSLKEIALEISPQSAITQDNVTLHMDGVLYLRVIDAYKASYGVENPEFAVSQLAQTTMRSEIGKLSLDTIFRERTHLNEHIVDSINQASACWGICCLRYEIRDIQLPKRVVEAMQMQVAAERQKRASILESEGCRESAINKAEGEKRSQILASEGKKLEQINSAEGEAEAIIVKANATASGIKAVGLAIQIKGGPEAVSLTLAQQYIQAFSNLAKEGNTLLLPANIGDPCSMIAQAASIYERITHK